jgi:hydrogenase/urease accessory protein HupE
MARLALLIAALLIGSTSAQAHIGFGDANGFVHGFVHPTGGVDHVLVMVGGGFFCRSSRRASAVACAAILRVHDDHGRRFRDGRH